MATENMQRQELIDIQSMLFERALEVMKQRNIKYAKADDALMNFRDDGLNGIIGILSNKISRLAALTAENRNSSDESLDDTIIDIINYAVLFRAVDHELQLKGKV